MSKLSSAEEIDALRELGVVSTALKDRDIQDNPIFVDHESYIWGNPRTGARTHDPTCISVGGRKQVYLNTILSHIKAHSWVHFCCHGTTDAKLPLLSAFHFAKFKLTIESLIRMDLPLADFAFLSVCHTAGGSEATNENMSLACALQLAGFRPVVATMYAVADSDGPAVARELYEHMFRDRTQPANSSDAALGLNKAVRKLRQAKTPMHRWVSYVHIGV